MRRFLIGVLVAPIGLLCGSTLAASYLSEPLDHVPSVKVHFDDLDIKKDEGAQELYDRITYAARRACGPMPDNGHLALIGRWDYCVNDARDRAVAHVNSPIVSRIARISSPASHTFVAAN